MSKNLRIVLFGLVGAVAGFGLQGCFAPQPLPECTVTNSTTALFLPPYFTKLVKVDGTGACSTLDHMYTGVQRFRTQASGGAFTLAVRVSPVVDPYLGYIYTGDTDITNNCVNEEDCQGGDDPANSCVVSQTDGGLELFDGTPVDDMSTTPDGGSYDLANECGVVEEAVERLDPTDPDGKKLNAIGKMPQFPTAGICSVTEFTGGVQNFQEEMMADGTTLPAVTHKVDFTNFNVINTAKVPGTAYTAEIKYTEGSCVANYKAMGFWVGSFTGDPQIPCSDTAADADPAKGDGPDWFDPTHILVTSDECEPLADLDAGRQFGTGMNPSFAPKCDTTLGVCVPSVDPTTLK
ncbi:MAG: hypothetical protein Q8L48_05815 [Archangium sp.]|nr:hypothetical protein [Archangium sp.]